MDEPTTRRTADRSTPSSALHRPAALAVADPAFPPALGRYERQAPLGRGGMGVVFRYRDPVLERCVAVKAVRGRAGATADAQARLAREARALARLEHPGVARVYDVLEADGATYIVMELVEGETLAARLRRGPPAFDEAVRIGRAIAEALAAGHAAGVVHRDVKPGNVMLSTRGAVRLLDFGLARLDAARHGAEGHDDSTIGVVAGTPGYMSPEQACGAPVDPRCDAFAFGCVLYECLCGAPAFPGATPADRLAANVRAEPDARPLSGLPAALVELVLGCLARRAEDRPADLAAVACALGELGDAPRGPRLAAEIGVPEESSPAVPRPAALAAVRAALASARTASVVGPGGAGKTRLAATVAHECAEAGRHRHVVFVALGPLRDPGLVARTIAAAILGTAAVNADDPLAAAARRLGDASVLLVLDECERLLDATRAAATALVAACPRLSVLATSRMALGLPDERQVALAGLGTSPAHAPLEGEPSEAEALFAARAAAVVPGFALDADTRPAVAEICRRVDGLPLAIELAAARLAVVPLPALLAHLSEVIDPSDRLGASIRSSVEALDDADRRRLGRVSFFRGGFDLDAAIAVCGDDAVAGLARLAARSLVSFGTDALGAPRYRMLAPIREHCRPRLLRGAALRAVRSRHATHYLALAQAIDARVPGPEEGRALRQAELEIDNLRLAFETLLDHERDGARALALATAVHHVWQKRGNAVEGRRWLERALAAAAGPPCLATARGWNALAIVCWVRGEHGPAARAAERALADVRALGDRRREAGVLTNLGLVASDAGRPEEALAHHRAALVAAEEVGDAETVAQVRLNLAVSLRQHGALDESAAILEALQASFDDAHDPRRHAAVLLNLGEIDLARGDVAAARARLRDGLALARTTGDRRAVARGVLLMGLLAEAEGRGELAVRLLASCGAIFAGFDVRMGAADVARTDAARARLRAALGAARFEALWHEGGRLGEDPATRLATGE